MNKCALAGLVLIFVWTIGCGGSNGARQAIEGNVTFDGQPLPGGQIVFIPQAGTKGPTAGSEIQDGNYSIPANKSTFAGTFRVEISAVRKTGGKITTSWGEITDEFVNYIPARYNKASELVAEVKPDGPNQINFSLQSNGG